MQHARLDYQRIQDPAELIGEDEPVFLVRAKDVSAPAAVRAWAAAHILNGGESDLAIMALQHADRMVQWQKDNGVKVADL